jgi:hypothetical protein
MKAPGAGTEGIEGDDIENEVESGDLAASGVRSGEFDLELAGDEPALLPELSDNSVKPNNRGRRPLRCAT